MVCPWFALWHLGHLLSLVAHDCGYPLSRYTCRATRVAADFLDLIAFCRCSTGVALHPLNILVSHLSPPIPGRWRTEIWSSEKVSRYTGASQVQLRVSRYTVQLSCLDIFPTTPLPAAQKTGRTAQAFPARGSTFLRKEEGEDRRVSNAALANELEKLETKYSRWGGQHRKKNPTSLGSAFSLRRRAWKRISFSQVHPPWKINAN